MLNHSHSIKLLYLKNHRIQKLMSKKSINPRKLPSQERSRKKVESILIATERLLEKGGVEEVTALKIAEEAGIAVASFYQYFPNKNAVICTLYQKWLQRVSENFDRVEKESFQKVSIFEFLIQINNELANNSGFGEKVEIELFRAMEIYPNLHQLDILHGKEIAGRLALYMKAYGSKWSMSRLKNLGWFIYMTVNSIIRGSFDRESGDREQFSEWSEIVLVSLLNECMK